VCKCAIELLGENCRVMRSVDAWRGGCLCGLRAGLVPGGELWFRARQEIALTLNTCNSDVLATMYSQTMADATYSLRAPVGSH
jgi:hypothetical protein